PSSVGTRRRREARRIARQRRSRIPGFAARAAATPTSPFERPSLARLGPSRQRAQSPEQPGGCDWSPCRPSFGAGRSKEAALARPEDEPVRKRPSLASTDTLVCIVAANSPTGDQSRHETAQFHDAKLVPGKGGYCRQHGSPWMMPLTFLCGRANTALSAAV